MPTPNEIRQRREAVMNSIKFYDEQHRDFILRAFVNLEYVQAECEHPEVVADYQISHFNRVCADCHKLIEPSKQL